MLHKTLEVKATTTDLGEFTALAATYSVDRTNERIVPGAFKDTIAAWQESGKQIPLHWDHMGEAHNVIGTVDPASMEETKKGLQVKGKLDLEESDVARDAWRLMKKDAVSLSFGYLVTEDAKAKDGVRELKAIDLFEVTITPAPANPDTRFLDMKSASGDAIWGRWASQHVVAPETKQCEVCGEWFAKKSTESRAYWETKRFCSMECKGIQHSADMRKGNLTSTGASFRQSARNYLEEKCAICGWDESSCDVAHIEPGVDALENVIMLCPNHHRMFDQGGISTDEIKGLKDGILQAGTPVGAKWKAQWSAAFINSLPDSSFLYIEPGGEKDSDGKTTPRNLRHFPYKDASGAVDLPHLRNALARIPQSNLSQDVKDRLTAKAQSILDNMKSQAIEGVAAEEPERAKVRTRDPLRSESLGLARETRTDGLRHVTPPPPPEPEPESAPSRRELKRRSRQAMLDVLNG